MLNYQRVYIYIYNYINIHTQNYTNGCIKDYTEKGCQNQYPGNI